MTDRTHEPSETERGTARLPLPDTPATKQVIAELRVSTTETADLGELVAELRCPGSTSILRSAETVRNMAADALTAERARAEEYKRLMLKVSEDCVEFEDRAEALEKERDETKEALDTADGLIAAVLAWGRERDMFAQCDYPDGITAEEIADELTTHESGCIEQSEARADKAEAEGIRARTAELAWEKHCKEAEAKAEALEKERDKWKEVTKSYCERQEELHRRAQKAEAKAEALEKERDELKLKLSHAEPEALACGHWVDMFAKANARADKAETEVAALKARMVEGDAFIRVMQVRLSTSEFNSAVERVQLDRTQAEGEGS